MTSTATKTITAGKCCTRCGTYQPKENFGCAARYTDGLRAWCKDCYAEYQRGYQREYRKKKKAQPNVDEIIQAEGRNLRADYQVARRNRELFKARQQRKQECAEPGCITLIGYHQQTLCRRHEEEKTEEKIAKRLEARWGK